MRDLLRVGDRLISVSVPGPVGTTYNVGNSMITSIGVNQLPGPMGFYLVANVIFEDERPDVIIPLHMSDQFQVLNP